jgi:Protein of unknown function (DUF3618)
VTTPTPKPGTEQLQEDIENAREQLGDTVEALAHKVNVPARAKDSMHDAVQKVQGKAGELGDEATVLANKAVAKLPPQARGRANQLVATIRQRPLPAALAAVGALLVTMRLLRRNR